MRHYLIALATVILIVGAVCGASGDFAISTYDDWVRETGPGGMVTPILSWDEVGFESLYPGQSDAFVVPVIAPAIDPDTGTPALRMGFGNGAFIGGITVAVPGGNDDGSNKQVRFSIKKGWQGKRKWSVHITDTWGIERRWFGEIPAAPDPPDPNNAYLPVVINLADLNNPHLVKPDDRHGEITDWHIRQIRSVRFDVWHNDETGVGEESADPYLGYAYYGVPEPGSLLALGGGLLSLTGMALRRRR